MKWFRKNCVRN